MHWSSSKPCPNCGKTTGRAVKCGNCVTAGCGDCIGAVNISTDSYCKNCKKAARISFI